MKNRNCKLFDIGDYQVLIMTRGEGDKDGTQTVEQSTNIHGLFVNVSADIPVEAAEKIMDNYNQDSAERFLEAVSEMIEDRLNDD